MNWLGRFVLFCGFLVVFGPAALAQGSVYGEIGATNYGYTVNGGTPRFSNDGVGAMLGGFYNFPIQSRLTAGLDAHVGLGWSTPGGVKGLVAGRIGFVPTRVPLRPYFQIGGGFVSTHVPRTSSIVGPQTITGGALELGAGLDVRVSQRVDWRAVELEGAAGGGTRAAGSASLSTGIVYHFGTPRGAHS